MLAVSLVADVQAPRILDVGCGSGALLRFVGALRPDAPLAGVDPAPEMVRAASSPRLTVVQATAESLPFGDGTFDLVVSSTSFSHWEDRDAGLRECRRVLAAGGALLGGIGGARPAEIGPITEYVLKKAPCRVLLSAPAED